MESLKSDCEEILSSSFTVNTVIDVLLLADKYNVSNLKSKCIDYIFENAHDVTHTNAWEDMANANSKLNLEVVRKLATKISNPLMASTGRTKLLENVKKGLNALNASRPSGTPALQLVHNSAGHFD